MNNLGRQTRARLLLICCVSLLAACSGQAQTAASLPTPTAVAVVQPTATVGAQQQAAGSTEVAIANFTFQPADLTLPVGATVMWVNHDDVPHTATSTDSVKAFSSQALDTDERFSYTFTRAGTYSYFCSLHPQMTARIVVK